MIPHSKPTIGKEEMRAVTSVLKNGFITQGKVTERFEEKFRKFIGTRYSLAVNSGTSGLHLALLALRIKKGDEVIIPSYVCTALLNAVNYVGATPNIADINEDDFNISVDSVKKLLSRRTKAIIAPHMFGLSADVKALNKLGVPVIEDCAMSLGASCGNELVGSFGKIAIFSFYATKMMATAEGGMILTDDRRIYNYINDVRDYDNKSFYQVRYNFKATDLASSLGIVQLTKLPAFISRRQKIAAMYNSALADLDIVLPKANQQGKHIYFRYVIRTDKTADFLINKLRSLGIDAKKPVFRSIHIYLGLRQNDFPVTNRVYRSAVSLPIYPGLKDDQVKFVINKLRKALK